VSGLEDALAGGRGCSRSDGWCHNASVDKLVYMRYISM
jgi:hypothetical protein